MAGQITPRGAMWYCKLEKNLGDNNNKNKNDNYIVCGTRVDSELEGGRKC